MAEMAHAAGVLFHTDAVQAGITIPRLTSRAHPIDMLSMSGHKLHAPKGIGVLYLRPGESGSGPCCGGGIRNRGRRAGTENAPAIVELIGKAAEFGHGSHAGARTR